MTPIDFKEANTAFKAPEGLDESQVMTIPAFHGVVQGGSMDGIPVTVVAWKPTVDELLKIANGADIYISFCGGLPAHFPCLSFREATNPA